MQVRPDTDVFLLAAMLHHLDRTVGFDLDRYGDRVHHLEPLRVWLADFSPDRVAPVVGVDAAAIERLAVDFAAAPSAAVHASTGVNMGRHMGARLLPVQMLSLVTGNLDRREERRPGPSAGADGGDRDPRPRVVRADPVRAGPSLEGLPARRAPPRLDPPPYLAFDQGALGVRWKPGSPALTVAGGAAMADALGELDLLVSVDLYRNATAELAHVALPATDWFERPDLNAFTQGVQMTPHIQLTAAVTEPRAGRKHETEIFALLSTAMGVEPLVAPGLEGLAATYDAELAEHGLSVQELAGRPRGLAVLPDSTDGLFATVLTPDGRIDGSPELVVDAMRRASEGFDGLAAEPPDRLRLITRRTRTSLNSALANISKLKSRGAADNPLWMHPDDAATLGVAEGDRVEIANVAGTIAAPVAFDPALRPGVVAMTHGFGFAANPGMPNAHTHPGVNVNILSSAGPGSFDPLSGMSKLTGIVVDVRPATDGATA